MNFPDTEIVEDEILRSLRKATAMPIRGLYERLGDDLSLTEAEQRAPAPGRNDSAWECRVQQAIWRLRTKHWIDSQISGQWQLTPSGRQELQRRDALRLRKLNSVGMSTLPPCGPRTTREVDADSSLTAEVRFLRADEKIDGARDWLTLVGKDGGFELTVSFQSSGLFTLGTDTSLQAGLARAQEEALRLRIDAIYVLDVPIPG